LLAGFAEAGTLAFGAGRAGVPAAALDGALAAAALDGALAAAALDGALAAAALDGALATDALEGALAAAGFTFEGAAAPRFVSFVVGILVTPPLLTAAPRLVNRENL
jgi:hypothetical protein